ncbi:MAG: hypothetical protein KF685_10445 [Acidobacteria bacterium]|nr:hypothetical protein [Acidobacteriota bacterium]
MNRKESAEIDQKYRSMATIWFILLMTQFMVLGAAVYIGRQTIAAVEAAGTDQQENYLIVMMFAVASLSSFAMSFFLRKKMQEQAEQLQKISYVQTGLIVACALCESISLFGFILAVVFGYKYFFVWFVVGIVGIFLHFPRRQHLINASYRSSAQ